MAPDSHNSATPERRQHRRSPVHVQVRVEHTEVAFSAQTVNLSAGGVFLLTEKRLPPGTRLRLRLEIPLLTKYPIRAEGEVVRREDDPCGLAVRFTQMADEDRRLLADLAERADHLLKE
ncbi:MAG: hypothetical protein GYA21_15505 [Myxococcales bacterium]|nr:hypothetical protein [Myxococcales bacterium]